MHKRTLPVVLMVALAAGACSAGERSAVPTTTDGSTAPSRSTPDRVRLDIDPRAYFDDYQGGSYDASGGAPSAANPNVITATEAGDAMPAPPAPPPPPPGPLEDNVFVDTGDSTWTTTANDAESTFALDVDTGSFSIGRTMLEEGVLPVPDSIRVEEWINAVDRDDPPPADGADLAATVETHASPRAGDDTRLIRIGISSRELADADRPPAAITFVVDTSGSMDIRERLGLVKSSLALLVQHLRVDDTIAIVTYGDDATPLLEPTPAGDAVRIITAIDSLTPGGSTNLEAGLRMGYTQARAASRADGINVVVLASDGVANVGVTDPTVLTNEITRAGEAGIHLVTVGFGMGNYNDHLMEGLADMGDGFYSYVDTFEEAERLFVDELTPTMTVVAGDAKAQVVFDADVVAAYRLIGYENRMLDDEQFVDDTVDAGEIGAGHHVTALYEVRLADAADPATPLRERSADAAILGELRLRWQSGAAGGGDAGAAGATEEAHELRLSIPASSDRPPTDNFRLAALVADLAERWKSNDVATERAVTLEELAAEADDLVAAGVEPAAELAAMIAQALLLDA